MREKDVVYMVGMGAAAGILRCGELKTCMEIAVMNVSCLIKSAISSLYDSLTRVVVCKGYHNVTQIHGE